MKKTITKSIIATIIAVVIAASSLSLFSASALDFNYVTDTETVGAAQQAQTAAKTTQSAAVEKTKDLNTAAKAYYFKAVGKTKEGYDWTYKTTNDIVKVKCSYDFKAHKYTFKLTGTAKGTAKITLMYKSNDKTWVKVPMTVKVDAQKNITRTA
ncbi:MAG: hypothetical protein IIU14_05840 [Ruminococcus sp.]|nr:hypothetical protein [Ruminococcus sp.]